MTKHAITYRLKRRAFLDALKTPTCETCGPLTSEPVDTEDARIAARQHGLTVAGWGDEG